jgi:hypothetical protein
MHLNYFEIFPINLQHLEDFSMMEHFARFGAKAALLFVCAMMATSGVAQSSSSSAGKSVKGKDMTVVVAPGQKMNIHLLPDAPFTNQSKFTYHITLKPKVGSIGVVGAKIGVVTYQAAAAPWSEDSFEFVLKDSSGVASDPAIVKIVPGTPKETGALVAENLSAKFVGPEAVKLIDNPIKKTFFQKTPVKIQLSARSSSGSLEGLSFKIIKAPNFGIVTVNHKTGRADYQRTQSSESTDSFTYSVVRTSDGSHSKPATVSLTPFGSEEFKVISNDENQLKNLFAVPPAGQLGNGQLGNGFN